MIIIFMTNAKEASVDKILSVHTLTWWPPAEDYMYSVSNSTSVHSLPLPFCTTATGNFPAKKQFS